MPLNCFWLSSQEAVPVSQDSTSTPPEVSLAVAASASRLAASSPIWTPVARHSSSSPPMPRPWLYVQTVWPLFAHDAVSPSLTRPEELISPLFRYQSPAVRARWPHRVSPAIRLCSDAVSRRYNPAVTAFLYVRSRFHQ